MTEYAFTRELDTGFDSAVQAVKHRLELEGFGVVTTIDVKDKLQEKLGIDFCPYVILGACDPAVAHKALVAEDTFGLMVPCNVVVFERGGRAVVAAIRPTIATEMLDNLDLRRIARDVERRLKHVIDSLEPAEALS
jgi:uncharacterized protein (DUF302 family)